MVISKMRALVVAAVLAAAALAVGVAGASTPSVTITTPKAGQNISLKRTPYLAVAGQASFAPATAASTELFLRRDGCGTSNDNPHLSVATGIDGGDGCGLLFNAVVGTGGDADQGAFIDFPATDGMPLPLNTHSAISGVISLTGAQVGLAEIDVTLEALINGEAVTLGKATGSAVLDSTGDHTRSRSASSRARRSMDPICRRSISGSSSTAQTSTAATSA